MTHIDPTRAQRNALGARAIVGAVTMLNLLRFRAWADYSATPVLAPSAPITGAHAYARYSRHTLPFLDGVGGTVVFLGDGGAPLIGPTDERWDRVMLVRYPSLAAFLAMTGDPAYQAGVGHRTAALEDSRLVPMVETATG